MKIFVKFTAKHYNLKLFNAMTEHAQAKSEHDSFYNTFTLPWFTSQLWQIKWLERVYYSKCLGNERGSVIDNLINVYLEKIPFKY